MAKKFTGLKKTSEHQNSENTGKPKRVLTAEQKKQHLKLLIMLIVWSVLLTAVYMTAIRFYFAPILYIYTGAGTAFFIAYYLVNGGLGRRNIEDFKRPYEMPYDEFCVKMEKFKKRLMYAKYLLIAFIPFPFILIIDFLLLSWIE